MSKRRKDGSWQSDHYGGRVQLQPHTGLHTLQHQPEPLPTSSRPHVSARTLAHWITCHELIKSELSKCIYLPKLIHMLFLFKCVIFKHSHSSRSFLSWHIYFMTILLINKPHYGKVGKYQDIFRCDKKPIRILFDAESLFILWFNWLRLTVSGGRWEQTLSVQNCTV